MSYNKLKNHPFPWTVDDSKHVFDANGASVGFHLSVTVDDFVLYINLMNELYSGISNQIETVIKDRDDLEEKVERLTASNAEDEDSDHVPLIHCKCGRNVGCVYVACRACDELLSSIYLLTKDSQMALKAVIANMKLRDRT